MFTKISYKTIIILSIIGLILSNPSSVLAQTSKIEAPETTEEAKELGEEFLQEGQKQLPGIIEKLWKEEVLPLWREMYEKWCNWWNSYIQPWLQNVWQKILGLLGQEVERRKPQIEEELEKEKEEVKEELPEVKKSLWERFKELIK